MTLYVFLPDESVDVWRPVQAVNVHDDVYRIVEQPYDQHIERWEFAPGDVVVAEPRDLGGETVLLTALRRVEGADESADDEELVDVDLTLPPERVREFCENTETWALSIPKDWTSADVEDLYRRHSAVADPYEHVISEIADDPRTPVHVLVDIRSRFSHLVSVASSLALNPGTPIELVEELTRHPDDAVREHAEQALQRRKER